MTVFLLHNAKATTVATTLQNLFKTTPAGRRPGSAASTLVAIPDDRLNALVVQANRADIPTIENLVRALDSAEVPDTLGASRMKVIPLKNMSATVVQKILQDRFKTEVDSISVEDQSNSVVVVASAALTEEIARAVKTLDDAAGSEQSQKVKLVQLHSTNAMEAQQVLDTLLNKIGGTSSSASRHTSTPRASAAWPSSSTWITPATSGSR
jgi:type II secretory pathway component GspD/PulD (secretin)